MSRARDTANQINRVNSSAADATAITVDSSENVGIGTSSPEADLQIATSSNAGAGGAKLLLKPNGAYGSIVNNDDLGQIAFGAKTASIDNTDNDSVMIRGVADGTWASNDYPTRLEFWTTTDGSANPTERIRIDNDGLKFNGDTAAANALSDYEEGSWTPSMSGMGTATFSQQFGSYTKIGDLVHASGKIAWTSANGSAQVSITGLPFTAADASDHLLRNSAWPQGDYRNIPNLIQKNGHFRVNGNTLFGVIDNTNGYTAGMTRSQLDTFGEFNFYLVYRST